MVAAPRSGSPVAWPWSPLPWSGVGLAAMALQAIGIASIGHALIAATPVWVLVAFALMCASMLIRAEAWHAILRAALPGAGVRRRDTASATMIGVLMSATLPARLGEPSRALILARRVGRMRDNFPVVLGSLVSQTLLNILALVILGGVMFATVGVFRGGEDNLVIATLAPLVLLALLFAGPALLRRGKPSRFARVQQALAIARGAAVKVRKGLQVFRRPKLGAWAATMQLSAWAVQWLACYLLLVALGLDDRAGIGAAAAVLFAVNVTAALPATPSNLGVFQAACVAVLSAYGVGKTDALAYGIILQAVEIATALAMGMPALVREGMTWKDLRLRALHAAPVQLRRGRAAFGRRRRGRGLRRTQAPTFTQLCQGCASLCGPAWPAITSKQSMSASSSSMAAWAPPWSSSTSRRRTTWASRASATRRSCSTAPT